MQTLDLDSVGTHLSLLVDTPHSCDEVFSDICIFLQDFEQKYSRFISGNWLDSLNKNRTGKINNDGKKMLEYMIEVAKKTNGYFDPTIGKRLMELGYGAPCLMHHEQFGEKKFGDYRDIDLNGDTVILHGDIILEFGGVGKGYLIDAIRSIIQNTSFNNQRYLINFGGDMYGNGGWKIGLESPFVSDEVIGTISLEDDFLACSAGTKRKWGTHHHLIDPHTGESVSSVIASYIEGASGMIVDSYATALCVMPWEMACEVFQKTPGISGVIVSKEGNIFQKEGSRAEIFI